MLNRDNPNKILGENRMSEESNSHEHQIIACDKLLSTYMTFARFEL